MEKKKPKVIFSDKAKNDIFKTALYIELKGFPDTAEKFADKLYEFGNSLSIFPNKYPICKRKAWAKRKYHCAVFKDYIIAYKVVGSQLIIYSIVHGRRLK